MSEAAPASVWVLPQIDGPLGNRSHRVEDLDLIERGAWNKGYAEGREVGVLAAREEERTLLAQLEGRVRDVGSILDFMVRPIAQLDDEVQRQMAMLAAAIARHLVRRELKVHPDEIVAVVRETVALLPVTAREVRVHLHPDDAALVRERLGDVNADRAWSIVQDPVLSRGGCRVTSERSTIDAQLEKRLGAVIAGMLGDERSAPVHGGVE